MDGLPVILDWSSDRRILIVNYKHSFGARNCYIEKFKFCAHLSKFAVDLLSLSLQCEHCFDNMVAIDTGLSNLIVIFLHFSRDNHLAPVFSHFNRNSSVLRYLKHFKVKEVRVVLVLNHL